MAAPNVASQGNAGNNNGNAQAPPAAVIPFVAAAHEHTEQFIDQTVTLGSGAVDIGPFDVPAFGYVRNIWLDFEAVGGTGGSPVTNNDYPYNIIQSISLTDVNGAPIYGPLTGYQALISNVIGGYAYKSDPRRLSDYDPSSSNPKFTLRIPIEITHHDGFGSLANQNSAAAYKVNIRLNSSANIWTTPPSTVPTIRVRGVLEAWSLPNDRNLVGQPQAVFPPVHGTTQFWTASSFTLSSGNINVLFPRVGSLIRNFAFICRDGATGARSNTVFPTNAMIQWDARVMVNDTQRYRRGIFEERSVALTALNGTTDDVADAGVFVYNFNHSNGNRIGDDNPSLWLPTVQATRLELQGTIAAGGRVELLVNDVQAAEVRPTERYTEDSRTGFHPDVGISTTS